VEVLGIIWNYLERFVLPFVLPLVKMFYQKSGFDTKVENNFLVHEFIWIDLFYHLFYRLCKMFYQNSGFDTN